MILALIRSTQTVKKFFEKMVASRVTDGETSSDEKRAETLARRLSRKPELRNDEDYLRSWLELASSQGDDADWVFERVDALRIGEQLALRWVAQAFVAEKAAKYAVADEIFSRGAACDAVPRDLLSKRRREFDRRMKRHWLSVASSVKSDKTDENSCKVSSKISNRRPLRILEQQQQPKIDAPLTQNKINRKLVFSTAKRDAPKTAVLRQKPEDLTINSAIAAKEIDDIFFDGADDDDRSTVCGDDVPPPPVQESDSAFAIYCD